MKVTNSSNPNAPSVAAKKTGKSGATKDLGGKTGLKSAFDISDDGSSSKIDFSSRAQEAKKAKEVASGTPDVDEAKVAKFQALIDSGKYKVDSSAVAERMIEDSIKNMGGEED